MTAPTPDHLVEALTHVHPDTLTAAELAAPLDTDEAGVLDLLEQLAADGRVTRATLDDDTPWMLHGTTRAAANGEPPTTEEQP